MLSALFMFGYTKHYLREFTNTTPIKIFNNGNAFYMRQSTEKLGKLNPTVYIDFQSKKKVEKILFDKAIIDLYIPSTNKIILTDGKNIIKLDLENKNKSILYSIGTNNRDYISSISSNDNGDIIVFTTVKNVDLQHHNLHNAFSLFSEYFYSALGNIYMLEVKDKRLKSISFDKKYGSSSNAPTLSENGFVFQTNKDNILYYDFANDKVMFITQGKQPKISTDGNIIIYLKPKTIRLKEELTEFTVYDIYRYDIKRKTEESISTKRNSSDSDIIQHGYLYNIHDKSNANFSSYFDLSADGNIIAYMTLRAKSYLHGYKYVSYKLNYYNHLTKVTDSITYDNGLSNFDVPGISLSNNGHYMLFSGNLNKKTKNSYFNQVYVKDMQTGELILLSDTKSTWFSKQTKIKF